MKKNEITNQLSTQIGNQNLNLAREGSSHNTITAPEARTILSLHLRQGLYYHCTWGKDFVITAPEARTLLSLHLRQGLYYHCTWGKDYIITAPEARTILSLHLRQGLYCHCTWGKDYIVTAPEARTVLSLHLRQGLYCHCTWGKDYIITAPEARTILSLHLRQGLYYHCTWGKDYIITAPEARTILSLHLRPGKPIPHDITAPEAVQTKGVTPSIWRAAPPFGFPFHPYWSPFSSLAPLCMAQERKYRHHYYHWMAPYFILYILILIQERERDIPLN